jgi:polar amino acid transport system substrate-binding protein
MRHLIIFLSLTFFIVPSFATEKESAYDRVMRTGTIRCGYAISPPVLVQDANTGKLSGMDYEVWEAIGRNLDVKIEWVLSSGWGSFIEDLRTGRFDAFCSQIWMIPTRTKFLNVTQPVTYTFLDAYVRPDDTRFDQDINLLNDEAVKIPVIDGDVTEYMATSKFPKAFRVSLNSDADWSQLYLEVVTKKADVFFVHAAAFGSVSSGSDVKLRKINKSPVFSFGARYAVPQGETVFRDMIDVALQSMIDDGTLSTMAKETSPFITTPNKNYGEMK